MEDIYFNIDSKYRDVTLYPNESKFTINLDTIYKNITSVAITSIELSNCITYLDSVKKNNFFTLHFPNKLNDPSGVIITLPDSLYPQIDPIQNIVNTLINTNINTIGNFEALAPEKYFYIFYLNDDVTINILASDSSPLGSIIIKSDWYSVYGFTNIITEYLKENTINEFIISSFTLRIFDRRFINTTTVSNNNIRQDTINTIDCTSTNNLTANLLTVKNSIYSFYLRDIQTFKVERLMMHTDHYHDASGNSCDASGNHHHHSDSHYHSYLHHDASGNFCDGSGNHYDLHDGSGNYLTNNSGTIFYYVSGNYLDSSGNNVYDNFGLLDDLVNNNFIIPGNYVQNTRLLRSNSKYHISSNNLNIPTIDDMQLYNLSMNVNLTLLRVNFENNFYKPVNNTALNFYYYYIDTYNQTWNYNDVETKVVNNVNQLSDLSKDVPNFEINFDTYNSDTNPYTGNVLDIGKVNYPTLGYYLGYRNRFYSSLYNSYNKVIVAEKVFNTVGNNYIFLRLNDWGNHYFLNNRIFNKLILNTNLGNPLLGYSAGDYQFKQPINVQKLQIEFIDYLGNNVNMNGNDISFTLRLTQIYTSEIKSDLETNYFNLRNFPPNQSYTRNNSDAMKYGTNYNTSFINKK